MSLTLDDVKFNPFSFTFTLQGLEVRPSQTKTDDQPLLAISTVVADLAPLSLMRNDLVSNALHINGLTLTIIRSQDNHYNFETVGKGKQPGPSSDIMSFSELPFLFSLNNISIREGKVSFQDIPSAATHTLEQVELDLPTLSNFPFQVDEYIHPRFSAIFNGSRIELTGQAAMPGAKGKEGMETRLSCNFHALDLPMYSQYLPTSLPVTITTGKADGNLQITFTRSTSEGPKTAINFAAQIADMELADKDGGFSFTLPNSSAEGTLLPMSRSLTLQKLLIRQPRFTSQSIPAPEQLADIFPSLGKIAGKAIAGTTPPPLAINLLQIEDGAWNLAPTGKTAKTAVAWKALQFNLQNFSTQKKADAAKNQGTFLISGEKADSKTAFSWQGKFSDNNLPKGLLSLENFPASAFFSAVGINPGTVQSGMASMQGNLSLERIVAKQNSGELTTNLTESEINLQNLKLLSEKSPWFEAPILKLAGFSKKGRQVDLKNIQVANATMTLNSQKLPPVFAAVSADNSSFSLHKIDYSGKITVLDKTGKPLILNSVLLQAEDLQSKTNGKETLLFSAKVNENGIFKAKGTARLAPFKATLSSGFSGLEAKMILPWFSSLPLLTEAQAVMSGKGNLLLPEFSFSGQLRLENAVFQREKKPLLSWKTADLQNFSFTRTPFHLGISLMEIDTPEMTWQRTAKNSNPVAQLGHFLQSLLPGKEEKASTAKESVSISQLDIQEIRFKNGLIHYKDNRLSPIWATEISALDGQVTALHSASKKEQNHYALSGRLEKIPFTVAGTADFFNSTVTGQSTFTTSEFPLSSFQEYLPATLGIDGSKGTFSLDLVSDWTDAHINHKAQFLFSHIQPTAEDADTALTLALLRNSDQQVALGVLPASGRQENSEPVLASAITAFQRQLTKAKVSPFLLASGDYTDLVGNEFAEFQPGGFTLSEKGQKTLSRFSTFLAAHPAIGIRIIGCADTIVDGNALKKQLEDIEAKRVSQENARRKAAWQHEKDIALERQRTQQLPAKTGSGKTDPPPPILVEDFQPVRPASVVIEESMLLNLARERATRVHALLTGKLALEPARIIVHPDPRMLSEEGNPGNRALISLQAFTPAGKTSKTEKPVATTTEEAAPPADQPE